MHLPCAVMSHKLFGLFISLIISDVWLIGGLSDLHPSIIPLHSNLNLNISYVYLQELVVMVVKQTHNQANMEHSQNFW